MQTRELQLNPTPAAAAGVPIPAVIASTAPVQRGAEFEILGCSPSEIDLSRAPLPLIASHDQTGLPVGVVTDLQATGVELRGLVRFGTSSRARELEADARAGVIRSLSVGYELLDEGRPVGPDGKSYRYRWRPLETSLVSVPADPSAALFRTHPTLGKIAMTTENDNITTISRSQRRALRDDEENSRSALELERARITEIDAMCRAHDIADDTRAALIRDGVSIPDARSVLLKSISGRSSATYHDASAITGIVSDMGASDRSRYSLSRAILAAASRDWSGAGLEREASRAIGKRIGRDTAGVFVPLDLLAPQRRNYDTLSGAAGGALVATNLQAGSFIELLRAKCRVMQLGATVLSGLVGNVDIPRRSAAGAAQWITEGQGLTATTGAFDVVSLRPKTVGSLGVLSRNLLQQGTPDAELLVRSDMIAQIAIAIDAAAINGSGVGAQPLGLLNVAGVGLVAGGANGAAITFDHLIDLSTAVAAANADSGALGFLSNSAVLGALSRLKSTTGEYLWAGRGGMSNENSAPASAVPGSTASGDAGFGILGYRAAFSNNVPATLDKGTSIGVCSAVLFGNWADLLIGEWGVLEILPNPYASGAYEAGAVQIRAMQSIDVAVRHAESFAVMKDALTA